MPQTSSGRKKVLKRKKMGNGGYRWFYGGKLISNPQAKRIKSARKAATARKLTGTKPRSNPPKRKKATTKPRSTRYVRATTRRKAPAKRRITKTVRRAKPAARRNAPKRKRVSDATRKKISAALKRYHRGTKRVRSNPPKKRRKAVARKKTTRRKATRRRTASSSSRKPRYGTKAYYRWLGRKGAAARKRKGGAPKRRRTKRNPPKRRSTYKVTSTRYARKRALYLRRKPRGPLKKHRVRRRTYKHRRTGASHYRYRIVKRNPGLKDIGQLFGKVLPIYGGFILSRIGASAINTYVVPKMGGVQTSLGKAAPLLSPALLLGLSVFLGPKVLKGKTGGQILEGVQLGSVLQIFDGIGKQFIAPALARQPMLQSAFGGYDDMGVMGMGAYMADPTGHSLPAAHASLEPGMGLDVHEAMALDAYVPDDGLGLNVEEALADSESDYMQRGGAGGSLSRTVFTY